MLAGRGADIDTGTVAGKQVFGIFAALAGSERELIFEWRRAGLATATTSGRKGGCKSKLPATEVADILARLAADPLLERAALAVELGIHRATLWRAPEFQQ